MARRIIILLLVVLVGEESFARCGKERWHIKTGTDPNATALKLTPQKTSIAKLVRIPRQHVTNSLPDDQRVPPVETTLYQIDATLTGYKIENDAKSGDGDYHLILADENGNSMDAEIPDPHCVDASSTVLAEITKARGFRARVQPHRRSPNH